MNQKLAASGSQIRIGLFRVADCLLLEKNAHYMPPEKYRQLVENIRADGQLTSVPFGIREGDKVRILSGNHRVQAARDAQVAEILVLYTEGKLSHQQQVAIQLSHNALVGRDDMEILRDLYDEIADVALKQYSGIDDALLGRMDPPSLEPLSEAALEFRVVSIAFLPPEIKRAQELYEKVMERCEGDPTWVNRFADYDRMLDMLTKAKETAGVHNTATAFGLILDLAENHLDEIPEGPKPGGNKTGKKPKR